MVVLHILPYTVLVVVGLKLSANNAAADNAVCASDENFKFPFVGEIYTCARIGLLLALSSDYLNDYYEKLITCDDIEGVAEKGIVECGYCPACADSDDFIECWRVDDKKCPFLNRPGVSTKKTKMYCKKNPTVMASCPLTCDNCVSNAPTDGYVCEDSTYEFSVPNQVAKYTCESLDRQFNVKRVKDLCASNEGSDQIKAMCSSLCDNCVSASPSVLSNTPSTNPTVSPTTGVDLKSNGNTFDYTRLKSDGLTVKKEKTGKKCKHLADESAANIKKSCDSGNMVMPVGVTVANY